MLDSHDSIALKDALSVVSPLIKTMVDTFVTPKLVVFRDKFKTNNLPTEENFTEYYHRTYKKLVVINTLVFNNSQRLLTDIYLPLTIVGNNKQKVKIEGFPTDISDEYGNILITDTAGMGKSTIMKTIFMDAIHKNIGIPIFIELRRLNKSKTILDEIKEQLNSINKQFDSKLLLELLAEGGFILIFDGYDEIALSDKDFVTSNLQEFISKASNNRFFITSRPEKTLSSFGNFQEFKISPLNKKEAFELLRKYDNQGQVSNLLIKKLQEKEMANVEEFLTNPLLVSLLFTAFEYKQAIPFKKYLFYRQVYDANFESHDLTKGDSYIHDKYSKLEIDDFHRVLRHIGFNCFKNQRIEFSKDELLKIISESKSFCAGLSFKESDFLQDIINTVPIFTQDGNYFRWSHKSLQEYFAAQFIYLDSKNKQDEILKMLYAHKNIEKFINVLDLYYDMDYKTFRNIIEFQLLTEYSNYIDLNYVIKYDFDISIVNRRRELTFLCDSFLFKTSSENNKNPFDDSQFDVMFEKNQKENELDADGFEGILVSNEMAPNVYAVHYQNTKMSLIYLLASKKNSIVKLPETRAKKQNANIKINYDFNNEFEMIKVTDSQNCKFNTKENFENINNFLEVTRLTSFTINHNNALTKLEEIKESIEKEKESNFILGNL